MSERSAGWWLAAPAVAMIGVFFALPVLAAFALSLSDFDIYSLADLGNLRFVGLANYVALWKDPAIGAAAKHSLVYAGASLALASAGHGNRFGHPHRASVERWTGAGARFAVTAPQGALRVRLRRDGRHIDARREVQPRPWDAVRRAKRAR